MPRARANVQLTKKYSPVMCQRLINVFADGGILAEFLKQEQMLDSLFRKWLKSYPEFAEAYEYAKICKRAHSAGFFREAPYEKIQNVEAFKALLKYVHQTEDDFTTNITVQTDKVNDQFVDDLKKFKEERWSKF